MSFTAERVRLTGKITPSARPFGPQYEEYWKLQEHWPRNGPAIKALLEQRGYATGAIKNYEWLRESLIRSDLGQMSYVSISNDELRGFITARGINSESVITKRLKGLRKELIQLLDEADQNPRFDKFMSLPAEIRNRIYEMYFAEFTQPLNTPIQPPLTIVSSQVRSETLQMFYSICQFEIAFVQHRDRIWVTDHLHLCIPQKTLLWFHSLSRPSLSALHRIRFDMHLHDHQFIFNDWRHDINFQYGQLAWFELEIVRGGDREELQLFFTYGPSSFRMANLFRVRGAVRRVVARINARNKKVCITADDLLALRKAMES